MLRTRMILVLISRENVDIIVSMFLARERSHILSILSFIMIEYMRNVLPASVDGLRANA